MLRPLVVDAARRAYAPRYVRVEPPYGLSPEGRQVMAWLRRADAWGLRPADYAQAWQAPPSWGLEIGIAVAWARFVADVAVGRWDPQRLGHLGLADWAAAREAVISQALTFTVPAQALAQSEPDGPVYRHLLRALAFWRERAQGAVPRAWPPGGALVRPGQAWPGLTELWVRLREQVQPGVAPVVPVSRLEGAVLAELRAFQARHGLRPDGVLGPRTRAALDVPPAVRVQQIEWGLERLRWLGRMPSRPYVLINLPEFRLSVYERGRVVDAMAVVVGRPSWPTPIALHSMTAVAVHPAWHVPRRIAAEELYDLMQRDPTWLARHQMVLTGGAGLRGPALRHALAQGQARLVQRPGPRNPLGRVRFELAESDAVYLHDTPEPQVFDRPARALSHGCVRLQRPMDLLTRILAAESPQSRGAVAAALLDPRSIRVPLRSPWPVAMVYSTVTLAVGEPVGFVPDVYGWGAAMMAQVGRPCCGP